MILDDLDLTTFDVETTGTNPETDRIVSAYIGVHFRDGEHRTIGEWLIDPGIEIPEAATEIHGITTERARLLGAAPADAIAEIEAALAASLAMGSPLVVMNAAYDLTMLDREVARHHGGRPLAFDPRPVLDPLVLDKAIPSERYRKGARNLGALCEHYGIPFVGAHDATADARAAAAVLRPILAKVIEETAAKGYLVDEITLDTVHAWQIKWRERQTDSLVDYWRGLGRVVHDADHPRDWPLVPRALTPEGTL